MDASRSSLSDRVAAAPLPASISASSMSSASSDIIGACSLDPGRMAKATAVAAANAAPLTDHALMLSGRLQRASGAVFLCPCGPQAARLTRRGFGGFEGGDVVISPEAAGFRECGGAEDSLT